MAPICRAHCAVIFAIAQLSCYGFLSQSLDMCSTCAVTSVILDTLIARVTYLLTYLLTVMRADDCVEPLMRHSYHSNDATSVVHNVTPDMQ